MGQSYKVLKDTSAFVQRLENMSKNTRALQSDFIQTKNLSMLEEKVVSKGRFSFVQPNRLRWEYSAPYQYAIVASDNKFFIKDGNSKVKRYDLNSNKVFREINDIMITCVNGDVLESGRFIVKYFENEKGYKIELTPKNKMMAETLKKITMYFDRQVTSVSRIEMLEPGGDITELDFQNKKINPAIAPETFILK